MDDLRAVLAISVFILCGYFVYDLFANGFSWTLLVMAIFGFVLVHWLWPPNHPDKNAWYESLEVVVDLPYRSIVAVCRALGRAEKSDGIDLDL